jgi:hypothetical protein
VLTNTTCPGMANKMDLFPQHPGPLNADLHMGRHRHRAVGIHHQVIEQRRSVRPQLRANAVGSVRAL